MIKNDGLRRVQDNDSFRAVINLLSYCILQGFSLLVTPLFTRLLTTEQFGITSIYQTWMTFISVFIGLQANGSLNNAHIALPDEDQSKYQSSILSMSLVSFLIFTCIVFVFRFPLSKILDLKENFILLMLFHAYGTFTLTFLNAYCIINKRPIIYMCVTLIISVAGLLLSLFLMKILGDKISGKIWGSALPTVIFGIAIAFIFIAKGKTIYNWSYWRFCLTFGIPLVFHSISSIILSQSDRIMLRSYAGDAFAGIYSVGYSVALPLSTLWTAMNSSWVPGYYERMKAGKYEDIIRQASIYMRTYTLLTIGYLLICPEVFKLLSPAEYWGGITTVPIIILGIYFIYLYSYPVNHELFHKRTGFIATASMLSAGINIVLNLYFIPHFNIIGAAFATLIAYLFLFALHQFFASIIIKQYDYYSLSFFLKPMIPILISFIFVYIAMDIWALRWIAALAAGLLLIRHIKINKAIL